MHNSDAPLQYNGRACMGCGVKFTLVLRKHHCRLCGQVFCNECSPLRAAAAMKKDIRICHECTQWMEEDDADDDDDSAASNPRFFEEHGSGGAASPPAHKSIAQLASDIDPGKLTAIELSGLLKVIGVQHDGGATKEELTAALSEVTGVSYDEDADDSAAAAAAAAGKTEKERHGALDRARVWSAPDPQTAATAAAAAQRDPDGYKFEEAIWFSPEQKAAVLAEKSAAGAAIVEEGEGNEVQYAVISAEDDAGGCGGDAGAAKVESGGIFDDNDEENDDNNGDEVVQYTTIGFDDESSAFAHHGDTEAPPALPPREEASSSPAQPPGHLAAPTADTTKDNDLQPPLLPAAATRAPATGAEASVNLDTSNPWASTSSSSSNSSSGCGSGSGGGGVAPQAPNPFGNTSAATAEGEPNNPFVAAGSSDTLDPQNPFASSGDGDVASGTDGGAPNPFADSAVPVALDPQNPFASASAPAAPVPAPAFATPEKEKPATAKAKKGRPANPFGSKTKKMMADKAKAAAAASGAAAAKDSASLTLRSSSTSSPSTRPSTSSSSRPAASGANAPSETASAEKGLLNGGARLSQAGERLDALKFDFSFGGGSSVGPKSAAAANNSPTRVSPSGKRTLSAGRSGSTQTPAKKVAAAKAAAAMIDASKSSSSSSKGGGNESSSSSLQARMAKFNKGSGTPVVPRGVSARSQSASPSIAGPKPKKTWGGTSAPSSRTIATPTTSSALPAPKSTAAAAAAAAPTSGPSRSKPSKMGDRKADALAWCQRLAEGTGVTIKNFSRSFGSGLAFCAIMHGLFPDKIPMATLKAANRRENFTLAFKVAEDCGQEPFLEIDDCVDMPYPDSLSVMTYIFELYRKFGKGGSKSKGVARF